MAEEPDALTPEAFDALAAGYWERARTLAQRMCRGVRRPDWVADAQDAATFQLLRATRRYDPRRGAYESFAYAVVSRRVRKFLVRRFAQAGAPRAHPARAVQMWRLTDSDYESLAAPPPPHTPIPDEYLDGLSLDQRQLLSLVYQEGVTNAGVAALTGRHRQSVGDRLARALARVRANVGRLQPDHPGAIAEDDTPQEGGHAVPNRLPQSKPPKPARPRGDRPSPSARGYDRSWQRRRLAFLGANPLCEVCRRDGRLTLASEVHHRVPLSQGGTHAESNLAALCKPCHSRTTARESSGFAGGDGG